MAKMEEKPFAELIQLFEQMEEHVDHLLRARRMTKSAREAARFVEWLRAQPTKTLVTATLVGMAVLGMLMVMTISVSGPKRSNGGKSSSKKRRRHQRRRKTKRISRIKKRGAR